MVHKASYFHALHYCVYNWIYNNCDSALQVCNISHHQLISKGKTTFLLFVTIAMQGDVSQQYVVVHSKCHNFGVDNFMVM